MSALPPLALIVCRARNGVIGRRGAIPWNLPEDRAHFRALTLGHTLLMGRRTYNSIGRPLDGRRTIILSRDPAFSAPGCTVLHSLDTALAAARTTDPCPFVCGGAQLYQQTLPLATLVYLTQLDWDADGDASFPALDPATWRILEQRSHGPLSFLTLSRQT